ncbi:MAG: DUF401 family protein [Spirochaetes bacterium]|nr:DUF401 family protein [Spirochaetota bacterium]
MAVIDFIFSIPFILRVVLTLFFILVINRLTKNLLISIGAGTIIIALWSGRSFADIWSIAFNRLISGNILFLVVILFEVIWLSTLMSKNGIISDLVTSVRGMSSNKAAMALLPAFIGLLPMPGGAIFSAPLVDSVDEDKVLDPLHKVQINYWFRHIWEFWWPLYPAVLLALDITGLPITRFMLYQAPLWLFMMLTGYIFLLRKVNIREKSSTESAYSKKKFLLSILPVIIIIFTYAVCRIFFPFLIEFNKYIPMCIGVFVAVIFAQIYKPQGSEVWRKIVLNKTTFNLVVIVVLIMIYGSFIDSPLSDGTYIMSHMRVELGRWGIPLFIIIMILPFISGMVTGIAVGFVGASFPIIMSLLGPNPEVWQIATSMVLGYGFGYLGMILSPVHICLIVTNRHFNTEVEKSITRLIRPVAFMMVCVLLVYFAMRMLHGGV